jgi:hypothetical protein
MQVERSTRIALLLKRVPDIEDVLAWYGLDVDPEDVEVTIEDLARMNRLDPDELVDDLQATVDERDGDEDEEVDDDLEDGLEEDEAEEAEDDEEDVDDLEEDEDEDDAWGEEDDAEQSGGFDEDDD